jgi:hypothetical protein
MGCHRPLLVISPESSVCPSHDEYRRIDGRLTADEVTALIGPSPEKIFVPDIASQLSIC